MALIGLVVKRVDYIDAARRGRRFLSDFFMPPSGRVSVKHVFVGASNVVRITLVSGEVRNG